MFLQLGQPLIHAAAAALIQQALGAVELFESLLSGLLLLLGIAALRLLLHVACRLLQRTADVGHLPVIIFAGELVELTGEPLGFLLQLLRARLIASAARATLLLHGSPLHQFLLALGKLLQFLKRFVDGLRSLVHLAAL